MYIHEENNKK